MSNVKSGRRWRFSEPPEKCYYEDLHRSLPEPPTEGSAIVDYFKGKTIFLTGATGFLGKIAIEKLLRCCPDIEGIFILCRDKKGKNMHDRTEEIFNDVLFSRLNQLNPKCRHKVTPIKGDVGEEGLGMSEVDRQLLASKVNVIFHIAATVRFDEKIRTAMGINVRGTLEMMRLGKECSSLDSFVHISTAFSHCVRQFVDETYYEMPVNYQDLSALIKTKTDAELEELCLYKPWPNTYTFTKAMAEEVIKNEAGDLPIAIFRPSIVISTYEGPLRGWIDNVYGPTGVITGAGLGILRSLYCDGKNVAEIVPVDWVVNAMITTAYKNSKSEKLKHKIANTLQIEHVKQNGVNMGRLDGHDEIVKVVEPPIYNYVSSVENPLTWEEYTEMNRHYGINVPTMQAFWYYSFRLNKYKPIHYFYTLFLQWLPAFFLDGLAVMVGKKPQLVKIYKKIDKFANVISYFSIRRWFFRNNNIQDMWTALSPIDQKLFPFDIKLVDWEAHSHMNIFGVRTFIIKEDPDTLPAARKKWQRLYIVHHVVKFAFYLIVLRVVYAFLSTIFNVTSLFLG